MYFNSYPVPQLPVCLTMWLLWEQFKASTLTTEAPTPLFPSLQRHFLTLDRSLQPFSHLGQHLVLVCSSTQFSLGYLRAHGKRNPGMSDCQKCWHSPVFTAAWRKAEGEFMVSIPQPEKLSAHKCHLLSQQTDRIKTLRLKPRFLVQIFALSTEKK